MQFWFFSNCQNQMFTNSFPCKIHTIIIEFARICPLNSIIKDKLSIIFFLFFTSLSEVHFIAMLLDTVWSKFIWFLISRFVRKTVWRWCHWNRKIGKIFLAFIDQNTSWYYTFLDDWKMYLIFFEAFDILVHANCKYWSL